MIHVECRVRGAWLVRALAMLCRLAAWMGLPLDGDAMQRVARRMVRLRLRVGSQPWQTIKLDTKG